MRQTTPPRTRNGESAIRNPNSAIAAASGWHRRAGFTLVELLVVIAIIALLSSLLLVAAQSALRAAARAQIGAQLEQLNTAIEDYKNNKGSYPPNAQTDDHLSSGSNLLDDDSVVSKFERHFNKAFPDHREPPQLIRALMGKSQVTDLGNAEGATNLEGGMNAAEALVFWLGGFSDDPKYPITGPGGPSYSIDNGASNQDKLSSDPIESRSWALDVNVAQLGPRDDSNANFFDTTDGRVIEYRDPRQRASDVRRRIQFWYLKGGGSDAPYVYFDASRSSSPDQTDDPPASTRLGDFEGGDEEFLNELRNIHALKALKADASAPNQYQFANNKKFQILHPGIDEVWGVLPRVQFDQTETDPESATLVDANGDELNIFFPEGPWSGDLLETLSNFTDGRLEDAAP